MNPAEALSWLVGTSAGFGLVASVRSFGWQQRGWLLVQGSVLLLAILGLVLQRTELSYVAAGCWLVFVKGVGFAAQRQRQFAQAFRFEEAARWGRIAGRLHPFDGVPAQVDYLLAQGQVHAGNLGRARELFGALSKSPQYADVARVELLRLDGDWRRIIEFVEHERADRWAQTLSLPYLRALGEVGEVSRMLEAYAALPPVMSQLPMLRLVVCALSGQPDLVRKLCAGPLAELADAGRDYWLAAAEQAAGNLGTARQLLESVLARGALTMQSGQRLATPLASVRAEALSAPAQRVIAALARDIAEDGRARGAAQTAFKPLVSGAGVLILTLVFCVRYLDGWQGVEGLVRAGALVLPDELTDGGAWWRVVTAGFLHINATHLAMNALGLWVLGRNLERTWGSRALLGCLLGSSVGAYAFALGFMSADLEHPRVLLGASAGVLGLVGAMIAFNSVGYFKHGNRVHGRRLRLAGMVVALQLVFDAFTPMVSSFLHLSGIACGALLAWPFSLRHFARLSRSPSELVEEGPNGR